MNLIQHNQKKMTRFSVEAIDHVEIYVEDQVKSVKWYSQVFGFHLIKDLEFWSANSGPVFGRK